MNRRITDLDLIYLKQSKERRLLRANLIRKFRPMIEGTLAVLLSLGMAAMFWYSWLN